MAEETTESVTTTTAKASDGTVKISVEKYEELMRKANEQKVTYNQTVIEKTPEMAASDKIVFGNLFMVAGVAQIASGAYLRF